MSKTRSAGNGHDDFHSREFEKRRRPWWFLPLLLVVIILIFICCVYYITQVPGEFVAIPETTGMENPILYDGHPDYSAAIEGLFDALAGPPEENGFREFLIACGPPVLGETKMMNKAEWADIPNDKKFYFYEQTWLPLCRKLEIDPHAVPVHLESRCFLESATRFGEDLDATEYLKELTSRPWSAEDHPELALWLEERAPVLDLFGECVRKSNFLRTFELSRTIRFLYMWDMSSHHFRGVAQDLLVRISNRIERGEIATAWFDAMSILYLSRHHLTRNPLQMSIISRISLETTAFEGINLILGSGNPDDELLRKFASDLAELPQPYFFASRIELDKFERYNLLYLISTKDPRVSGTLFDRQNANLPCFFPELVARAAEGGIDPNIAAAELSKLYDDIELGIEGLKRFDQLEIDAKKVLIEKLVVKSRECQDKIDNELTSSTQIWTIQARSKVVARAIFATEVFIDDPLRDTYPWIFDEMEARKNLAETAIGLERFRLASGDYPEKLEELCPKYLPEVPRDPFGEKIIYKPRPNDEFNYLIYSLGRNKTDEGGDSEKRNDIVFEKTAN